MSNNKRNLQLRTSPFTPQNNDESTLSMSPVKILRNNSNNNNTVREVNAYIHQTGVDPSLFLTPDHTYLDSLKQAIAVSNNKAKTNGDYATLFVNSASYDSKKQAFAILNNPALERSSKIEQTDDIIKNLFQYTFYKGLRSRKHAVLFLNTILDIITERKKALGRVEGDRRLRRDIEQWIDYASGRRTRPPSGTRRALRGGRRTQKRKN